MVASKVAYILKTLPEYLEARRVGIYLSMPSAEISTKAIVLHALQEKKKVFVPYIYRFNKSDPRRPKSAMDMVSLQSPEDYESLQPDSWGIPTPGEETMNRRKCILGEKEIGQCNMDETRKENLEIIIMPGVAFDRKLSRLGHGKGFYDSFLERYHRLHTPGESVSAKKTMPFLGKVHARNQNANTRVCLTNAPFSWACPWRATSASYTGSSN